MNILIIGRNFGDFGVHIKDFKIRGRESHWGRKKESLGEERSFSVNQSISSFEILVTISQINPCLLASDI